MLFSRSANILGFSVNSYKTEETVFVIKLQNKVLNSEAIMKELEVLVSKGSDFSIFYCKDAMSFFDFSYYALNFVISLEKD